jgi:hypothetical protein
MVRLNWLRLGFVQYRRHGGQDRDAEYGRSQARGEIVAFIEQVLSDRPGEWQGFNCRVSRK